MMKEKLIDLLKTYCSTSIPMHMPGHKRNTMLNGADYLKRICADCDITEIDGFDDLHNAHGILSESMRDAAKLWGSDRAYFLVNGSTCGILAGIKSIAGNGGRVVVARNCHKSVYNALELCRLEPYFIYSDIEPNTGAYCAVNAEQVVKALETCPDAKLVIVTSPTYEGIVSDISGICREAHKRNIPVLVDEAHGAHLGFGHGFPDSAVHAKADIVVQSLHKTLPSLTQTAILHLNGSLVCAKKIENALDTFETSSPSYLLMSSIDGCVHLLEEKSDELFEKWNENLNMFHKLTSCLTHLNILGSKDAPTGAYDFDKSKIVICTQKAGICGAQLMERLRSEYSIECEMASERYVIAMTGMGDTEKTLKQLAKALLEIDTSLPGGTNNTNYIYPANVEIVMPAYLATTLDQEAVSPETAAGRVSAEYFWAYPPGIPLYIPGERIGEEFIKLLSVYATGKITLRSNSSELPDKIYVIKDK